MYENRKYGGMAVMKKYIIGICLSFLILIGFQSASAAETGTCGTNVKYIISGNEISFSRDNSLNEAIWGFDCREVFRDDPTITVLEITETIKAIDTVR